MSKVLVVGGAGYVGSASCAWLHDHGHEVWVLDDLSMGHRELVLTERFVRARVGDLDQVLPLLKTQKFDCVMHFGARSLVAESVAYPELYRENNVEQTRALLQAMRAAGTQRIVFSSTAAVFGEAGLEPIGEDHPKNPINPYGETKLEVERMLEQASRDWGLRACVLRYFNAAGAEPQVRVGEWHEPETHLIPRILRAAERGEAVGIFGTDFPTRDGTCVRDYIHVTDLAEAHAAAMKILLAPGTGLFRAYNLGTEKGCTVREVIAAAQRVLGRELKVIERPRRAGDPPSLVADSRRARIHLGFKPRFTLDQIIETAWKWEKKRVAQSARRAIFLDRDGTLNEDPGYLSDPAQMALLPQVGEALSVLKKAGYELIVVSNQSGVGRGLITSDAIPKIHARLDELLAPFEVKIDHFELCFHRPEEDCLCRKPKSKLLIDGAAARGVDLSRSFMIGDKVSDVQAGVNAGCRGSLLVRSGHGAATETALAQAPARDRPAYVGETLLDVARWITESRR